MIKSKSIDLIRSFSEDEFKKFGLYLTSPFFNKEKILFKTYKVLRGFYPGFDSVRFTKANIFSRIYPGKEYNDSMIRNILSKLLEHTKNFLSIMRYIYEDFDYNFGKIIELNKRGQQKLFAGEAAYLKSIILNSDFKDEDYYYRNYLLDNERRKFNLNLRSTVKSTEYSLESIIDNLALSFMINALKNYTYIMNTYKYAYHYEENKIIIDGIENYIKMNYEKLKDETHLIYWYDTYMLAKTRDEQYYKRLFLILDKSLNKLNKNEKHNIFTILANYAYTKINEGDLSYLKEQFKIYRKNLEYGLYRSERKFFSHILYINITVTALESGEFKWAEQFIEKYKNELDGMNRENTFIFCRALIHYHLGNYDEAMETALKVTIDDPSYKHQLKSLYLKIYFDLNEVEHFYFHIDSYKHFVSKSKELNESVRRTINNYITFSKRLFELKNSDNDKYENIEMLKKEIIKNKAMINKPWLLRKIAGLNPV